MAKATDVFGIMVAIMLVLFGAFAIFSIILRKWKLIRMSHVCSVVAGIALYEAIRFVLFITVLR